MPRLANWTKVRDRFARSGSCRLYQDRRDNAAVSAAEKGERKRYRGECGARWRMVPGSLTRCPKSGCGRVDFKEVG